MSVGGQARKAKRSRQARDRERPKALPAQPRRRDPKRVLSSLQEIFEELAQFQGKAVDPKSGEIADLTADERKDFKDALRRRAFWTKAALRLGLGEHPLVKDWLDTQRRLGRRKRLRGTGYERGVRRPLQATRLKIIQALRERLARGLSLHKAIQQVRKEGPGKGMSTSGLYALAARHHLEDCSIWTPPPRQPPCDACRSRRDLVGGVRLMREGWRDPVTWHLCQACISLAAWVSQAVSLRGDHGVVVQLWVRTARGKRQARLSRPSP